MQTLILIRHGESEGNSQDILTGQLDVPLTTTGREQAERAGQVIGKSDISFDAAYSSKLRRARETMDLVISQLPKSIHKVIRHSALDERDFGEYTGIAKASIQNEIGNAEYKRIVKGWDVPAPHGESLHDVQLRVLPFFHEVIMTDLTTGKNVLVASHHQTLRALIKHIENVTDDDIRFLSIEHATPMVYVYDPTTGTLTRGSSAGA
jgi:2,3-bisphosphoglycerate-dependent phosphoglycerate mutase